MKRKGHSKVRKAEEDWEKTWGREGKRRNGIKRGRDCT